MQQATRETVSDIEEICTVISEVAASSTAISSAVAQQASATCEIARNLQLAANDSEITATAFDQVNATTMGTTHDAAHLHEASETIDQESARLRASILDFFERVRCA